MRKTFTVRIRRDIGKEIRPESEQIDGKAYQFTFGWEMGEDDPYPGEAAWIPHDKSYPLDGPTWVSSGDLEEA